VDLNVVRAGFLGVLQGLTEFLPVSSSGHLVLAQHLFGLKEPEMLFNVVVHLGSLAAICLVLRREVLRLAVEVAVLARTLVSRGSLAEAWRSRPDLRLLILLGLGTLPAGALGLAFRSAFESLFSSIQAVGAALLFTGLVLFLTRRFSHGSRGLGAVRVIDALAVGLAQAVAIAPGISRSGMTISSGIFLGIEREAAARYSFLLSIPVIVGAFILEAGHGSAGSFTPAAHMVGFVAAFLSGGLTLYVLLRLVRSGRLHYFAYYCWLIGALCLVLSLGG
jgi:undecaprenyl-diphosphatase